MISNPNRSISGVNRAADFAAFAKELSNRGADGEKVLSATIRQHCELRARSESERGDLAADPVMQEAIDAQMAMSCIRMAFDQSQSKKEPSHHSLESNSNCTCSPDELREQLGYLQAISRDAAIKRMALAAVRSGRILTRSDADETEAVAIAIRYTLNMDSRAAFKVARTGISGETPLDADFSTLKRSDLRRKLKLDNQLLPTTIESVMEGLDKSKPLGMRLAAFVHGLRASELELLKLRLACLSMVEIARRIGRSRVGAQKLLAKLKRRARSVGLTPFVAVECAHETATVK